MSYIITVSSICHRDHYILSPFPSMLVYLWMPAISLNTKYPLDCPHKASIEIHLCKMAAHWEHWDPDWPTEIHTLYFPEYKPHQPKNA